MLTENQIKQLEAKLDSKCIKSREKGGAKLSYIEGWHAIAEANRIFGYDNWDRETVLLEKTCETELNGKPHVGYLAKVKITVYADGKKIIREGTGSGSQTSKDLADAHEGAVKEAETDAMKRAFMTFGNPFGLALYDKAQNGVDKPLTVPEIKDIASRISLDIETSWSWEDLDRVFNRHKDSIERMPSNWADAQQKKFDEKGASLIEKGVLKKLNGQPTGAAA